MDHESTQRIDPRIVLQIEALSTRRRLWVARDAGGYQTLEAPTQQLPHFEGFRVLGLLCAETPGGRLRIAERLVQREAVRWREVSIRQARAVARRLAKASDSVVHLALVDEGTGVQWEPVPNRPVKGRPGPG